VSHIANKHSLTLKLFPDDDAVEDDVAGENVDDDAADAGGVAECTPADDGTANKKKDGRGRTPRPRFELGSAHPLANDYDAVLRLKTKTPMFGGRSVPAYPGAYPSKGTSKQQQDWVAEMNILSKYLLCTFVPWAAEGPVGDLDFNQLAQVLKEWDSSKASFTNRSRARYMRNLINKTHRHSKNEITTSLWRARNADWWKDIDKRSLPSAMVEKGDRSREAQKARQLEKKLKDSHALRKLASRVLVPNGEKREYLQRMSGMYKELLGSNPNGVETPRPRRNKTVVFEQPDDNDPRAIPDLCSKFLAYRKEPNALNAAARGLDGAPVDSRQPGERAFIEFTGRGTSTPAQWKIVDHIVNTVNKDTGRMEPTYTFLNAGAGVGKSFIGRKCNEAFAARGQTVINMCPTGAGACQMTEGHTFHSIMHPGYGKTLSPAQLIRLRNTLPMHLALVIVDEVSMLASDHLVILDARLRQLYDSQKVFGGISVLLLGDLVSSYIVSFPTCSPLCAISPLISQSQCLFQPLTNVD
jgi:hypothetical protein